MLTPEQVALRRSGIGGSEIAAVLGESRFASPFDVWLSKVEGWQPVETEDMRRGSFLEAGIANWYAQRNSLQVFDAIPAQHRDVDIARCTPDRWVEVGGDRPWRLLSIKAPRRKSNAWGEPGTANVPAEYALQLQWEHLVTSNMLERSTVDDEMHLAALLDGDLAIYVLRADPELQAWMLEYAAAWWWRHVVAKQPPSLDGSAQASAWLKSKFPRNTEVTREATPFELNRMLHLELAQAEAEKHEREVETLKSELKLSMGDVACLTAPNGSITWRADKNGKRSFKTNWRQS